MSAPWWLLKWKLNSEWLKCTICALAKWKKKNNANFMAPFYGWGSTAQGCRATTKRQFTFYYHILRSLWYSFDRHRKEQPSGFEKLFWTPTSLSLSFPYSQFSWPSEKAIPITPLQSRWVSKASKQKTICPDSINTDPTFNYIRKM